LSKEVYKAGWEIYRLLSDRALNRAGVDWNLTLSWKRLRELRKTFSETVLAFLENVTLSLGVHRLMLNEPWAS